MHNFSTWLIVAVTFWSAFGGASTFFPKTHDFDVSVQDSVLAFGTFDSQDNDCHHKEGSHFHICHIGHCGTILLPTEVYHLVSDRLKVVDSMSSPLRVGVNAQPFRPPIS